MIPALIDLIVAATLAGLMAVGVNRLFPKRGDWLPVLMTTFLPPLLIVAFSTYRALISVGLMVEHGGEGQLGPIEIFSTAVGAYFLFAGIWLFIASPAAFAALNLARRK